MRILSWYILRQHLVPFLLGLGVVTFLFQMDALFQYLDLVLNRGVPVWAVVQMFVLSLGFVAEQEVREDEPGGSGAERQDRDGRSSCSPSGSRSSTTTCTPR